MRKQQTNPSRKKIYPILAIGHSQSDPRATYGVPPERMWYSLLSNHLNKLGCLTIPKVFAISGQTAAQFLGRSDVFFMYPEKPGIICLDGDVNGPNDTETGTAQAGSANTITLRSAATTVLNSFVGSVISITSGTGSGQSKTIISYSGTGQIATVDSNWSVTPNNTSVYSIAAPTQSAMQATQQALIKVAKYAVVGYGAGLGLGVSLWNQSQLPPNGFPGQRFVIMQDNNNGSGAAKTLSTQHDNVAGNYSSSPIQSVWEYRNPQAGVAGWGRVAINTTPTFSEGVSKVIISGSNYLNYSSGGDNWNPNTSSGTQYTPYVSVRAASLAAAQAESVIYCDDYDYYAKLIWGGTYEGQTVVAETTQGSNSWHYTAGNQHHNQYGHEVKARAVLLKINNQSNWITDLSS